MSKRNQDLILFFLETESEFDIENRLVRLYMNRFTVDENDQTEIIGVNNIVKTREQNVLSIYHNTARYYSRFVERARKTEKPFTDLHCILPLYANPLFFNQRDERVDPMEYVRLKWLLTTGRFKRALEKCFKKSLLGNCLAFTILNGSPNRVLVSKNYRNHRYQYQNSDVELEEDNLEVSLYGICRSINDDLERLRRRILNHGIAHRNLQMKTSIYFIIKCSMKIKLIE